MLKKSGSWTSTWGRNTLWATKRDGEGSSCDSDLSRAPVALNERGLSFFRYSRWCRVAGTGPLVRVSGKRIREITRVCERSQEFAYVHESLQASTRVYKRLYAFTRVCKRLQEFTSVCMRSRESASVYKSLYAFKRVCERLQESTCVCMRSQESTSVYKSLLAFVCVHESLRAFTRVCMRSRESASVDKSLHAFVCVHESLRAFTRVCLRLYAFTRVYERLQEFVCVQERVYGRLLLWFGAIIAQKGGRQGGSLAWGATQFWCGNCPAGNQCQRWLALFTVFWRDTVQAPGLAVRWSPSVGEGARAGTWPALTGI